MNLEVLTATILSTLGEALRFGYVALETRAVIDFGEPKSIGYSTSEIGFVEGAQHILDREQRAEITL